jgi:hypothetical protein
MNEPVNQPNNNQQGTIPMIELDEFEFPRRELIKLFFRQLLWSYCKAFAYVAVFAVALAIFSNVWFAPVIVSTVVFFFACLITGSVRYFQYVPSAKETQFFQKRKISIDADKLHIQTEDGSEAHALLTHYPKVNRLGNYYCVYVNAASYMPIPVTAFRSEEDRIRFETEIFGDVFKGNSIFWKPILIFLLVSVCLIGSAYSIRFIGR